LGIRIKDLGTPGQSLRYLGFGTNKLRKAIQEGLRFAIMLNIYSVEIFDELIYLERPW
jgi:hypothetical protein